MFLNWNEYRSDYLLNTGKFAKLKPEFMKKAFSKWIRGRQKTSTSISKPMN